MNRIKQQQQFASRSHAKSLRFLVFVLFIFSAFFTESRAQLKLDGSFRLRWYSDVFSETMDGRDKENYMRLYGKLHSTVKASDIIDFNVELLSVTDNPNSPTRNISGTGSMRFAISQIFAELNTANFFVLDALRFRAGRQQFQLGNGLSFGESHYYLNKFDAARLDLAYDRYTLTAFGSITGQNVSQSGLYPDPGSDQIYVMRGSADVYNQDIMAYYILNKPRGDFNDSYVLGGGVASNYFGGRLEYFAEAAYQRFNTPPNTPVKAGIGYMAGAAYRFGFSPFKSIKVESKYAAYEGDDKSTTDIEQFSPPYPSFFWGERTGYVNGEVGGDHPHANRNLEGCRIWYSRIYFIPLLIPKLRVQFQYTMVNEYINNDAYNSMDDEWAVKVYYNFTTDTQFQFRYGRVLPNDKDFDVNKSGAISSTEDRVTIDRFMMDFQISF